MFVIGKISGVVLLALGKGEHRGEQPRDVQEQQLGEAPLRDEERPQQVQELQRQDVEMVQQQRHVHLQPQQLH